MSIKVDFSNRLHSQFSYSQPKSTVNRKENSSFKKKKKKKKKKEERKKERKTGGLEVWKRNEPRTECSMPQSSAPPRWQEPQVSDTLVPFEEDWVALFRNGPKCFPLAPYSTPQSHSCSPSLARLLSFYVHCGVRQCCSDGATLWIVFQALSLSICLSVSLSLSVFKQKLLTT